MQGKIAINYLLSLGRIEDDIFRREYYSPIYYSLKFLFIQIFPIKYQIEASHLINLIFSIGAIVGIKKLTKELFNENVGKIVFLILFFYPIFYGHMAFNSKDTIIAFCHVWIFFLCIRYIKKQYIKDNANNHINFIAVLSAVGTGINLFFLGSLIPILLFLLIDIFFLKKITCKTFDKKKFLIDLSKGFVIFYFLLVIFWIDTHPNIFILPFNFFLEWVVGDFSRGYPYILVNGDYFIYKEIPKSYLFINFIYKSPEYFLLTYVIFLTIF
jgi:4-amino-4-deoxy-L-arabinose transferase-like glycosyltransferase